MMGAPNDEGCNEARSQITRSHSLKCGGNNICDEDNIETKFQRCKDNDKKHKK
jgi:hypothetical protein